ncbi:hypothetical protein ACFFRR_011533 [Megaselia abdita]
MNPNGSVPKTENEIFMKLIGSNSTVKTTLNSKMIKSASTGNSPADAFDNRETYNGNSYEKLQEHFKALELLCETYKEEYTTTFKDLETYKTEIVNLRKQLGGVLEELKEVKTKEELTTRNLKEQCKHLTDELETLKQTSLMKEREFLKEMMVKEQQTLDSKEQPSSNVIENGNQKDLILTKMAKEKLLILQKFRENQITNLQTDVADVHELIKEQLKDFNDFNFKKRKTTSNKKTSFRLPTKNKTTSPITTAKKVTITSKSKKEGGKNKKDSVMSPLNETTISSLDLTVITPQTPRREKNKGNNNYKNESRHCHRRRRLHCCGGCKDDGCCRGDGFAEFDVDYKQKFEKAKTTVSAATSPFKFDCGCSPLNDLLKNERVEKKVQDSKKKDKISDFSDFIELLNDVVPRSP